MPTNPPSFTCSRLLAKWPFVVHCAFWALLSVLAILAALIVALHLWIVPRINTLRPWLQQYASSTLGASVQIGSLNASRGGLIPSLEVHDVLIVDAHGNQQLSAARAVASFSVRSLLAKRFRQLYMEHVALNIRRQANGQISIVGKSLALPAGAATDEATATSETFPVLDWVFSQPELVLRHGTIRWSDEEQEDALPVELTEVDAVLRNSGRHHAMRLDATPPAPWGSRFTLMGDFQQPLFTLHAGRWQEWSGTLYGDFPQLDISQSQQYIGTPDLNLRQGKGCVRLWADIAKGQLGTITSDLNLQNVDVTLGKDLAPLALRSLLARVGYTWLEGGGFDGYTQGLQFTTATGVRWPGGNFAVRYEPGDEDTAPRGTISARQLDIAALARIVDSLPVDDGVHSHLGTLRPAGIIHEMDVAWKGHIQDGALQDLQASGQIIDLSMAAQDNGIPGMRGVNVSFHTTQEKGSAKVSIHNGMLALPRVFEDADVGVRKLDTDVHWTVDGHAVSVQLPNLQFENADAQGSAQITWQTNDAAKAQGGSPYPGILDLRGTLTRADGARVHRYLPLAIPASARHYVRDAVRQGDASEAIFRIRGDLHYAPFAREPDKGEFHISANVHDAVYAYVPARIAPKGSLPWPALTHLAGSMVFERASMTIDARTATFENHPHISARDIHAHIANLEEPRVEVSANMEGPLSEALEMVKGSPVLHLTDQALAGASGTGSARYDLQLDLPIARLEQSRASGTVYFSGNNEFSLSPSIPRLSKISGSISYSEDGFALNGVKAQSMGGNLALEGGMQNASGAHAGTPMGFHILAKGEATAQGMAQDPALQASSVLLAHASGSTSYDVQIGLQQGVPEILVQSSLRGLALDLPEPLAKSADAQWPLRIQTSALYANSGERAAAQPRQRLDMLEIQLDNIFQAQYQRALDRPAAEQVLRGRMRLGTESSWPGMPASGVVAHAALPSLDADHWLGILDDTQGEASDAPFSEADYVPDTMHLDLRSVRFGTNALHDVRVQLTQSGDMWRAMVDAPTIKGTMEYRQQGKHPSLFYARLGYLNIGPSPRSDGIEDGVTATEDPTLSESQALERTIKKLPALDVQIQDFVLRGMRLGQVTLEATNQEAREGNARQWKLDKLDIAVAGSARFSATGTWGTAKAQAPYSRTSLDWRMDVENAGDLLEHMDYPHVLKRTSGTLSGHLTWSGSPLSPDYPSMSGNINADLRDGQFLKADAGAGRLLGVLSLQSLPRRLMLDFRDVFSEGFAFDFVRGDATIKNGVAQTNNLHMKGMNAAAMMQGSTDLAHETQDLHVVVIPEINAGTASLVAGVINPAIGLGTFLAQMFLRGTLMEVASQEFHITGTWSDPQVRKVPGSERMGAQDKAHSPPEPATGSSSAHPAAATPTTAP